MKPVASAEARASAAWGAELPDWVAALARACDAPGATQRRVADAVGYTPPVISQILKGTYKGNLKRVETVVRGAFMAVSVNCPVLGSLPVNECLEHQRRDFDGANHQAVALYRACPGCPHKQSGGPDGR